MEGAATTLFNKMMPSPARMGANSGYGGGFSDEVIGMERNEEFQGFVKVE